MSNRTHSYCSGPGINSEELIKELLQSAGWRIKELRKAADPGRAPMLEADLDPDIRIPDFQLHHPKHPPRYVEVKSKKGPIEYRVQNSVRHGYEKAKHDDYLEFRALAQRPLYVFIHERKPGMVLRQRVRNLSVVDVETNKQKFDTNQPMVFFERHQFDIVTDDISQYSAGFGQAGLIDDSVDVSPFGLTDGDGQTGLDSFKGDADD